MKASAISAVLLSLCLVTLVSAQDTFTVDINRTDGGGAIGAGDCFEFEIVGHLMDGSNEGLAFFAFDLEVVSDPPGSTVNLGTAVIMSAPAGVVDNFSAPQGYSVDFTGTVVGDDLIQAGGGQNTIRNCPDGKPCPPEFPDFPMGDVALGVGHGVDGVVLFEAPACVAAFGFTVPGDITPGTTYTFQIKPGSLYANVITSHDVGLGTYVVDPVTTVIGGGVVFGGCDAPTPEIVHASSIPCSGTVDAAIESSNGSALDRGLQSAEIHFNTEVYKADGSSAVDASNFSLTETGGGAVPAVTAVGYGADNTIVIVDWDRPLTLQEWTTIHADVYSACGAAITNLGDLGAANEPDRVDIAFLPGDVDRTFDTGPFDLLVFRQIVNGVTPSSNFGCSSNDCDYIDSNRSGVCGLTDPFDLLTFRQIVNGVSPTTRVWNGAAMNNPRP